MPSNQPWRFAIGAHVTSARHPGQHFIIAQIRMVDGCYTQYGCYDLHWASDPRFPGPLYWVYEEALTLVPRSEGQGDSDAL